MLSIVVLPVPHFSHLIKISLHKKARLSTKLIQPYHLPLWGSKLLVFVVLLPRETVQIAGNRPV